MNDYIKAHVRTLSPTIVAFIATWLAANANIIISDSTSASATLALMSALTAAYYIAVRWLGRTWPQMERLLGAASAPTYSDS